MTEKEQCEMFKQNKENIKWEKLVSLGFIKPRLPLKQDKKIFQLMNLRFFFFCPYEIMWNKTCKQTHRLESTHQKE